MTDKRSNPCSSRTILIIQACKLIITSGEENLSFVFPFFQEVVYLFMIGRPKKNR